MLLSFTPSERRYERDDVRAGLAGRMAEFAAEHWPGTPKMKGGEVRIDGNAGLSIKEEEGKWYHHGGGRGGDAIDLVGYHLFRDSWNHGDARMFGEALRYAGDWLGLEPTVGARMDVRPAVAATVRPQPNGNGALRPYQPYADTVQTYTYVDADGAIAFHVDRRANKEFPVWHETDAGPVWGLGAVTPTLYRLPQVARAIEAGETVYVCEGEKDADSLAALGFAATTAPGGAAGWSAKRAPVYAAQLRGAAVVLLPDNDEAGRRCMADAAEALALSARSIRTLELYSATDPEGFDVSDWIAGGGTAEELLTLADERPVAPSLIYVPTWQNRPPDVAPVLTFMGRKLAEPGGLSALIAGAGYGKSGGAEAICARTVEPECDGLGFSVDTARPILYLDTERTKSELWWSWHRMMQRARLVEGDPRADRIHVHGMKMLPKVDGRREYLLQQIDTIGPGLVILDGLGDFVRDPNDGPECAEYVAEILAMAERMDLVIVATLHPNPGSEKARGHLGSEIWRRGGSLLYVKMDPATEQRTITSEGLLGKVRHGAKAESHFMWSDEAGMFLTCENAVAGDPAAAANITRELAARAMIYETYAAVVLAVAEATGKKERTAKSLVAKLTEWGYLVKDGRRFLVNTSALDVPF